MFMHFIHAMCHYAKICFQKVNFVDSGSYFERRGGGGAEKGESEITREKNTKPNCDILRKSILLKKKAKKLWVFKNDRACE